MIINTNVTALNTYSSLSNANSALSKSTAKLSSGFRINTAADDAAGLAISEKMRTQINGLEQATRNAQDGISLIQTAEGALSTTESILQRIRELTVQSSNDTNTASDRAQLQQEVDQLLAEVDRIADTTEFNTKKLLNGASAVSATTNYSDANDEGAITFLGGTADTQAGATETVTAITLATADNTTTTGAALVNQNTALQDGSVISINGTTFTFDSSNIAQDALDAINGANLGVTISINAGEFSITDGTIGSKSSMTIEVGAAGSFAAADTSFIEGVDANVTGTSAYIAEGNKITIQTGDAKGLQFEVNDTFAAAGTATVTVDNNGGLNMQIGANAGQTMFISVSDMRASALGVSGIDVSTAATAQAAMGVIEDAIQQVSSERARLGAYQNRMEHTINNLSTSSYNLTAAESRIRDVDMAKEMMAYTTQSILVQSSTAMLAQANQQPQSVLQLLG